MATPPVPPSSGAPSSFEQVIVPPTPQAIAYPPAPFMAYGVPPPPRSGSTVLKIVLIVVGIVFLCGIVAAGVLGIGAYKLSKAVRHGKDGDISFSTPGASLSTGAAASITDSDLGVPEYPGAVGSPGSMKMRTASILLVTAVYTTLDPPPSVIAFYQQKMGDGVSIAERSGKTVLTSEDHGDDKIIVSIGSQPDGSKITIVRKRALR